MRGRKLRYGVCLQGALKQKKRKARATCVNGRLLARVSLQQNRWLIYRVPVGRALLFAGRYSWLGQLLHLEVSLDVINCLFTPSYRKLSIYKREDQWWSTAQRAEGVAVCLTCCECATERHSVCISRKSTQTTFWRRSCHGTLLIPPPAPLFPSLTSRNVVL